MTHPIPQVVEAFGHADTRIIAAYRPPGNGFGRRTGWNRAVVIMAPRTTVTTLRRLKDQGFTKVEVSGPDQTRIFTVEELLA